MELLKEQRRLKRMDITKTTDKVNTEMEDYLKIEKMQFRAKLQKLQQEVSELDSKIFELLFNAKRSSSEIEMEYITTEEYDCKLVFTITALQNSIDSEKVSTNNARTVPATTKLKLPRIPLPEYAHKEGEDLFKFFTNFEQILQKYELTEYEKFVYLQNQLSNEPLTLIKSLKLADQNYATAKALLEQAVGSLLTQQFRVLHNLENLKLAATDDSYQFISDMRLIIDSFERLKIDTKVILQYFIWNGLNNEMKTQLVHITNTNKPSLDEIQKHIFDATERYQSLRKFNS